MKIEKILTVTYRTLLTKTTNFSESDGLKNVFNLRLVSAQYKFREYVSTGMVPKPAL